MKLKICTKCNIEKKAYLPFIRQRLIKEGIDHIKPLASFDLTNREQFLEACNYKNLQPLWAKENLSKGSKVNVRT